MLALAVTTITGVATLSFATAAPASACCTVPEHAKIVCQTASFYTDYIHGQGPVGFKYTLRYDNKVGHTRGAHPVYNGWAATYDFGGPNSSNWGFVRYECLGKWGSW